MTSLQRRSGYRLDAECRRGRPRLGTKAPVGPENLRRLIMLKIFFRIAILLPYELHFIFRDQLRDERVALPTFPTA